MTELNQKSGQTAREQIHAQTGENTSSAKLNWLRAAVLGANDGIVSISGLVIGVASATSNTSTIAMAGVAGVLAGALSMAAGEYVSVSTQRDAERAMLAKEQYELDTMPELELQELAELYEAKGLSPATANLVATELTKNDAFAAHVDAELNIDPKALTNPWHAAYASALAFVCGAAIPMAAILLPPPSMRIPLTFVAVLFALAITGTLSAKWSNANIGRAVFRVVMGGALAMIVTYAIGSLFNINSV